MTVWQSDSFWVSHTYMRANPIGLRLSCVSGPGVCVVRLMGLWGFSSLSAREGESVLVYVRV